MKFRKCTLLAVFALATAALSAQNISGVVNAYAAVEAIDYCNNRITISPSLSFNNGDRVILIQMQGASVSTTNNASYGSIADYANTGNYEILTIDVVNVNVVSFQQAILRDYDLDGNVQIVKVGSYNNPTITDTLTCLPWDGQMGGVLALEVSGTLTFNDVIDVSGKGFRGGQATHQSWCNTGTGYTCTSTASCGGEKGEGISIADNTNYGRGARANGGGGGNVGNTGGGGGSGHGTGGVGGQRMNTSGADCAGSSPGIGGYGLSFNNTDNKIYMGGGGGAGASDNMENTRGGNGGGIVIIVAGTVAGNSEAIYANGETIRDTVGRDGAGGGGGGGTIIMDAANVSSALSIFADGGDGGNNDNDMQADSCLGPGGGGGGGLFWFSGAVQPANLTVSTVGGNNGMTTNANAPGPCAGGSNGAQPGNAGNTVAQLVIPQSLNNYVYINGSMNIVDTAVCLGDSVLFSASVQASSSLNYSWSSGETSSSIMVQPVDDTTAFSLTVTDARGCFVELFCGVKTNSYSVSIQVSPDTIIEEDESVVLSFDTVGLNNFVWTSIGIMDSVNTLLTQTPPPSIRHQYCLSATDRNGCKASDCAYVNVEPKPFAIIPNVFSPNGDGLNDVWHIEGLPLYTGIEIEVVSRWGDVVYRTPAYDNNWNGTYSEGVLPDGTYYYVMKLNDEGDIEVLTGTITIVR